MHRLSLEFGDELVDAALDDDGVSGANARDFILQDALFTLRMKRGELRVGGGPANLKVVGRFPPASEFRLKKRFIAWGLRREPAH